MKRLTIVLGSLFLMTNMAFSQVKWGFDKAHSAVLFTIDHMVISEVTGKFEKFDGTVETKNDKDFTDAKITFTIDASSINTFNEKRDEHLRSPEFFDVKKYPTITFKSTSMKKIGKNAYKLTGNLTMHGVTKEVTLDVKYNGTVKDPWGNTKAGFKVLGKLNRTDFGLTYNSTLDNGGLLIGEEVAIIANIELMQLK